MQNRKLTSMFSRHSNSTPRTRNVATAKNQQVPSSSPQTFIAYTGTSQGNPLVGGQDLVSQKALTVLWAGSTLAMAQQFQDGEVRKLEVTLQNPLVLDEDARRQQFGKAGHSWIVDRIQEQVLFGAASWDGVVFVDTVDGMEVADVMAVFPNADDPLSVDHAVQVIGTLSFDDITDDWVASPGFYDDSELGDVSPGHAP